ncbi:MAG: hypothetical protein JO263_09030 [Candidatus Eremiobacteraeota bacterium]|nr:hypothetical protein [Candidatus Eremiobacteraeota bacterium]
MIRHMTEIRDVLAFATERAIEFLDGLDRRPVNATAHARELRSRIDRPSHDCADRDNAQAL